MLMSMLMLIALLIICSILPYLLKSMEFKNMQRKPGPPEQF